VNLHKSSGFSYDWMLRFLKMAEEAVLKLPPFGSDGDGEANGGADGNAKQ